LCESIVSQSADRILQQLVYLKKNWESTAADKINVGAALPFAFRDGREIGSCIDGAMVDRTNAAAEKSSTMLLCFKLTTPSTASNRNWIR
jgi:hypothetical protein